MDAPSGPVALFPDIISTIDHLYKMVLCELSCKIPQLDTGLGISKKPRAGMIMINDNKHDRSNNDDGHT